MTSTAQTTSTTALRCEMRSDCPETAAYLDTKGYIYCTGHGQLRQSSQRCRKLRPAELRKLERGEVLTRY